MTSTTLAQYILDRLDELKVECIFGVPGDFTLSFLDLVIAHPQVIHDRIKWIGWSALAEAILRLFVQSCVLSVNELNAAYAADGYARATGLLGVLSTTFGVGELSALNGVAGSYSERVPVIRVFTSHLCNLYITSAADIVGMPTTVTQSTARTIHHCLGDGRFDEFIAMSAKISVDQAILTSRHAQDEQLATSNINRVFISCMKHSRPVYIGLPADLLSLSVSLPGASAGINNISRIQRSFQDSRTTDQEFAHLIVAEIMSMYKQARNPAVLVDVGTIRFHLRSEVQKLVESGDLPFYTTPMGQGALDEEHSNFCGVYYGQVSQKEVQDRFESSDFVLHIGACQTDFNTGSFVSLSLADWHYIVIESGQSYTVPVYQTVELHYDHVQVRDVSYPSTSYYTLLPLLNEAVARLGPKRRFEALKRQSERVLQGSKNQTILQDVFWSMMSTMFREGDIILADAGTCSFGVLDAHLPKNVMLLSQILWASIGYTGGAVLGAAYAAAQRGRRCIMLTGEGAWQETIQDLSTVIRLGLKPIIFVINNKGFTVERLVGGPQQPYNDVPAWEWQLALRFMGAKEGQHRSYSIETAGQLDNLLTDQSFLSAETIQLVEVHMDKLDAPRPLRAVAALMAKAISG